jgi:hypothetical protein
MDARHPSGTPEFAIKCSKSAFGDYALIENCVAVQGIAGWNGVYHYRLIDTFGGTVDQRELMGFSSLIVQKIPTLRWYRLATDHDGKSV